MNKSAHLLLLAVFAFANGITFAACAETWILKVTPAQAYENGQPLNPNDIVSHYVGCGRDSNQMNEHTFTVLPPNIALDGSGEITADFSPGQWYCFSRTNTMNGEDSVRSETFIFVASDGTDPPPTTARPLPPTLSGHAL